jgi:hypothetical protein
MSLSKHNQLGQQESLNLAMKPEDKPVKDLAVPILKYKKPKQAHPIVDHYQENTIPHHLLTV